LSTESPTPADRYDVAILGGGLAGLTLSIQLKRERPDTKVAVLEKRAGPAPLATFKVGESSVPAGAHYFAETVGMKNHLMLRHFVKFGLRFWMPSDDNRDLTKRIEFGPPDFPPHDNFQIDRGLFENELTSRALYHGVDVLLGSRIQDVELGGDLHTVTFTQGDAELSTQARWLVDAAGRSALLKKKLDLLEDTEHTIDAAWIRLAGGLDIEDFGRQDRAWMEKMPEPGLRQFSTNHLLGEGYWVWMIPLSTGPISIGVCADPRYHPFEELNDLGRWMAWLGKHEPQLAAAVEPRRDQVEDFLKIQNFSYGVKQTYSTDRWALVGEAAAFADPFYSPGSDFIGYGNTISGDLIKRELDGEDISDRVDYFNDFYQRTFASVMARYTNMYPVMGKPAVFMHKLIWDQVLNHSAQVVLMVHDRLTNMDFMRTVHDEVLQTYRLNMNYQRMILEWYELEGDTDDPLKGLVARPLVEGRVFLEKFEDDPLREAMRRQRQYAEALAVAVFHRAASSVLDDPPDPERTINPYAVSLSPERWEADGLFDGSGMTLEQAVEVTKLPARGMGPPV
jgi:flavin-dependent dehydrogenase